MVLYFLTGNKKKFEEVKAIIPQAEQIDIELDEIQSLDSREIIEHKLKEATKKCKGEFFCEDTSLHIRCLNDFPGPLIKWFLLTLKDEGIAKIVSNYENSDALAKTIIGYSDGKKIRFFEGSIGGNIVLPRKETDFGWDSIFQPKGHNKTFAEMSKEEKNKISMRRIALEKLSEFLKSKS